MRGPHTEYAAINILFAVLLYVLGETVFQIVGEMFAVGVWRSITQTTRLVSNAEPLTALIGCVLLGAFFGGLSGLAIPHRIVRAPPVPGLSVVVAPLVTATLMELYGRWRQRSGRERPWLATFSGGGMFAFVFAFVRLLIVHVIFERSA